VSSTSRGILQTWQVGAVGLAAADYGNTSLNGRRGLLYLLMPFARADTRHIAKHPLSAKTDAQPVPHRSAGAVGVIAATP